MATLRLSSLANETNHVMNPDVRQAWNGNVLLAYQVLGQSRGDLKHELKGVPGRWRPYRAVA